MKISKDLINKEIKRCIVIDDIIFNLNKIKYLNKKLKEITKLIDEIDFDIGIDDVEIQYLINDSNVKSKKKNKKCRKLNKKN